MLCLWSWSSFWCLCYVSKSTILEEIANFTLFFFGINVFYCISRNTKIFISSVCSLLFTHAHSSYLCQMDFVVSFRCIIFKAYNSVASNTFTMLCNRHHCPLTEPLHRRSETVYLLHNNSSFPSPPKWFYYRFVYFKVW